MHKPQHEIEIDMGTEFVTDYIQENKMTTNDNGENLNYLEAIAHQTSTRFSIQSMLIFRSLVQKSDDNVNEYFSSHSIIMNNIFKLVWAIMIDLRFDKLLKSDEYEQLTVKKFIHLKFNDSPLIKFKTYINLLDSISHLRCHHCADARDSQTAPHRRDHVGR